ncbi:MAG: O-antigen ligase family protein [Candidatus Hydrogenedentes bacterium]|nr:O-antigen ligase family protein [Candidatus Hydrogenedentota bacterium]
MSKSETPRVLPPVDELALAFGVGIIIFLRPWYDGITYAEYNVTFTWACAALAALWAVLVLVGRMQVRYVTPIALLSMFVFVALCTAPFTVQYNATYRALINWAGYLMLFAVVTNGLRSRTSIAIVLAFFVLTSVAEAFYGVLHVNYIMPRTRALIMEDPSMVQRFFKTNVITPELSSRLESNRASGSLLFANALACWVLVGIPFAIGTCIALYHRLRSMALPDKQPARSPAEMAFRWRVLISTIVLGISIFIVTYIAYYVYFIFAYGERAQWSDYMVSWIAYTVAIPMTVTVAAFLYASKHGPARMWTTAAMWSTAVFGIVMVYGLGATYSRGGILATVGALAMLAGLMFFKKGGIARAGANATAAAVVIAALVLPLTMASHAQAHAQEVSAPPKHMLSIEGVSPSFEAMVDPNTAFLRFGYWISGLKMFASHPLTGVGLGNFGTAYPMYQLIGAGDVKPAHNDYLQTAAETGAFGLLALLAFWAYFVIVIGRGVLSEADRSERWFRAGLLASVTGFLFHSFVDFNFYNPSLAALAFVFAGLNFAVRPGGIPVSRARAITIAVVILVLALWSRYAGDRVNHVDVVVGREVTRNVRLETASLILDPQVKRDTTKDFAMYDQTVAMLIEDQKERESIGRIYVPTNAAGTSLRTLRPGEAVPPDARLVMPPDMAAARAAALRAMPRWIEKCIDADRVYPYDPDVSGHIIQWYDKLREFTPDREQKIAAADEAIRWSEECKRRSPIQVAYHDVLGRTLWERAALEPGVKQHDYYDRAIESFKQCTEIYPIKPELWREYGRRCIAYGEERVKAGDAEAGEQLVAEGRRAEQHASDLVTQIHARALGRG